MASQNFESEALQRYRAKAAELGELRKQAGETVGREDLHNAQHCLEALQLRTREFEELRNTLSPTEMFLVTYGVSVIDDTTVSFVIPKGCSAAEIIGEARGLSTTRPVISDVDFELLLLKDHFTKGAQHARRICINGNIPGSQWKTFEEQRAFVQQQGLSLPTTADLAVAFVTFYIATGEALSGWDSKENSWSFMVTAVNGGIQMVEYGLIHEPNIDFSRRAHRVAAGQYRQPEEL